MNKQHKPGEYDSKRAFKVAVIMTIAAIITYILTFI